MQLRLKNRTWETESKIGSGSFGGVYSAFAVDDPAVLGAVKLVQKEPGADRELLFANLQNTVNVIPIIDTGEREDDWVLVMPLAEMSLKSYLDSVGGPLPEEEVVRILTDIAAALDSISTQVVHRDLKPHNILLYNSHWNLADFGISRYADASTALDTLKDNYTALYAAPEQWNMEHATPAADVYALGVVAYQLLTGDVPFTGNARHILREKHLHTPVPPLANGSLRLRSLVEQCMAKPAGGRPTAKDILDRLSKMKSDLPPRGLARLQEVNLHVLREKDEAAAKASKEDATRRTMRQLYELAVSHLEAICVELRTVIDDNAPNATIKRGRYGELSVSLNRALLILSDPMDVSPEPWGNWDKPNFIVAAQTRITVTKPQDQYGYSGRSHSLWYCDYGEPGVFGWFEMAFVRNAMMIGPDSSVRPYALDVGIEAAKAFWRGTSEYQIARSPAKIDHGDPEEFVHRWAGYLGEAANGTLQMPHSQSEM